jgi:hypothetical protein
MRFERFYTLSPVTQPASGEAKAFAMRKTFEGGSGKERRLDGRVYRLEGLLFCEVDGEGKIHRGNGAGLEGEGDSGEEDSLRAIAERFRSFEREFARSAEKEPLDPEVQRGLEALGYTE